jgi:twitching motility protein PilT
VHATGEEAAVPDNAAMDLASFVASAAQRGASDLHLQAGQHVRIRVLGELETLGGAALSAADVALLLDSLLSNTDRTRLAQQRSLDFARDVAGLRCRINVLMSHGAPGFAVRLLSSQPPTLASLNLHPDFARFIEARNGLVLVSGPTGSGKSSTLAAFVDEINRTRPCHIVTIEQPVEFDHRPQRALIRQREVGRDTPSVEQALMDALREDIDVLMVGEMRERQTMRLTLDACETGHLVLATLHSATVAEALQRLVAAFPAEEQPSVCSQLADCLQAVICQRLPWREAAGLRVPECEVLVANTAVRANVRQGQFFKLGSLLETNARAGMWTYERYRGWLDGRTEFSRPPAPPQARAAAT